MFSKLNSLGRSDNRGTGGETAAAGIGATGTAVVLLPVVTVGAPKLAAVPGPGLLLPC